LRKLLVKLVAVETALVGWLAYWIFLVYSNNPSVAESLASQLSKFPQLSFTTVDITVLVIIGGLSIFLAFKFQTGLKPGIRLERSLQMLESLMKRNLMLEAQVAEMKMEKAQITAGEPALSPSEPPQGSWEKAFRTPIEAGPAFSPQSVRPPVPGAAGARFGRETVGQRAPPPRIETKPTPQIPTLFKPPRDDLGRPSGKVSPPPLEKTTDTLPIPTPPKVDSSAWEDSPKYLGGTGAVPPPSPLPHKKTTVTAAPGSHRQPYIPVPAPKAILPSVILGPGVSPTPRAKPSTKSGSNVRALTSPQFVERTAPSTNVAPGRPPAPSTLSTSPSTETTRSIQLENASGDTARLSTEDDLETQSKPSDKPSVSTKKRFPWEDD